MRTRGSLTLIVLLLLAGGAPAQLVGSPLPSTSLTGFTGTKAKSLDEFAGRCVLIEFFSYW